jgi:transposase
VFIGKGRKLWLQFKAEAVQIVIESGSPVAQTAHELHINERTLGNWIQP